MVAWTHSTRNLQPHCRHVQAGKLNTKAVQGIRDECVRLASAAAKTSDLYAFRCCPMLCPLFAVAPRPCPCANSWRCLPHAFPCPSVVKVPTRKPRRGGGPHHVRHLHPATLRHFRQASPHPVDYLVLLSRTVEPQVLERVKAHGYGDDVASAQAVPSPFTELCQSARRVFRRSW